MATKDDIRRAQEHFEQQMKNQGVVSFGGGSITPNLVRCG